MAKRLTSVSIEGLKNHVDSQIAVPALLALEAPNGGGKSTSLSAIRIAVRGYEPELGKTLAATRQLVADGHDEARIALTFDDGFGIERRVGASNEIRVWPQQDERTKDEMQERINEETGNFVVSFDLAAFLSLSEEKRREFLLGILPRTLVDIDHTRWRDALGYDDGADDPVARGINAAVDRLWQEHLLESQSVLDGLASAIAYTRANANAREQERLAQAKVAQAAARDAVRATEQIDYDPARADVLQSDLAAVTGELGELREQQRTAESAAAARRRWTQDLADLDARENTAREQVGVTQDAIERAEPANAEAVAELVRAAEHAARKARAQQESVAYCREQHVAWGAQRKDVAARVDALTAHDACPICGASENLADVRARLAAELERASAATDAAAAAVHEAEEELVRLNEASIVAARAHRSARDLGEQTDALHGEVERAQEKLTWIRDERTRLQAAAPTDLVFMEAARLTELGARAGELRAALTGLQELAVEAGRAQADRERADREAQKLTAAEARAAAWKSLLSAQLRLRAAVIQQLVQPLEEHANALLSAIDSAKTFRFIFERENKDAFDFGFEEDGAFRGYNAASTGERAFLAVVFVAAMVAAVQPAWRVLIVDNIESIDDDRRRWLMLALAEMGGRFFDNIVLAGCCKFADVDGWEIVRMRSVTGVGREAIAA